MLKRNKGPQLNLRDAKPVTGGDALDEALRDRVGRALDDGERVVLVAHSDIGPDGRFGEQWLVVTNTHLLVFGPEAEQDGAPHLVVSLKDVEGSQVEMQVGRAILQVTMRGLPRDVITYSNSYGAPFNKVSRALDDLAKSEKEIDLDRILKKDEDERFCPRCERILPPWSPNCPACVQKGRILRRLFGYLRPYWLFAVLAVVLSLGSSGLGLVPPLLMKQMIDKALKLGPDAPLHTSAERLALLLHLVVVMLAVQALGTAATIAHGVLMTWLGGRVTYDVRAQLYTSMQHLALKFFDKKDTGGLMSRVTRDSEFLQHMVTEGAEIIVRDGLLVIGISVMLLWLDWHLALWVMLPVPLIAAAAGFFWRRIHVIYHRLWHRWSKLFSRINEAISGVRIVKAFAQEDREVQSVNERAYGLFRAMYHADRVWAIYFPTVGFAIGGTTLLIWWIGGSRIINETGFTLGSLFAYFAYVNMFYRPVQSLGQLNSWMQRSFTAAERVFEIIDTEPEEYENPDATPMPRLEGHVKLTDVTFGYDKAQPVLRNITLDVAKGEMIGLVGHSGAGKSTLINLICRFYDADEGDIEIDGVNVKDIRLTDLRHQIGAVLQEPFLFNATIADNIAYGKPQATREEVIRAARAANAHEFIIRMPDGYDTVVGERGSHVSGGERQRISIARAILHDPAILILDEATASVDTETEQQIQEAIGRLISGRTTFAIAHRLSTLRNANRLMVLEHGKLVELGTHDELMEQDGTYHRLVELQRQVSAVKAVDG